MGEDGLVLNQEYRKLSITFVGPGVERAIPLERLYPPKEEDLDDATFGSREERGATTFSVSLPISGEPSRYPFDWYLLKTSLEIDPGPRITWVNSDDEFADILEIQRIPSTITVGAASLNTPSGRQIELLNNHSLRGKKSNDIPRREDIPDWTANLLHRHDYERVRYGESTVHLLVSRSDRNQYFVLAMAMVPLLLLLVVASRLVPRLRPGGLDDQRPMELPVELAAAFLAVLSLRQVLVPNEVEGLTILDFILGAQLGAFIGLVVMQYALALLESPDTDAT